MTEAGKRLARAVSRASETQELRRALQRALAAAVAVDDAAREELVLAKAAVIEDESGARQRYAGPQPVTR